MDGMFWMLSEESTARYVSDPIYADRVNSLAIQVAKDLEVSVTVKGQGMRLMDVYPSTLWAQRLRD